MGYFFLFVFFYLGFLFGFFVWVFFWFGVMFFIRYLFIVWVFCTTVWDEVLVLGVGMVGSVSIVKTFGTTFLLINVIIEFCNVVGNFMEPSR